MDHKSINQASAAPIAESQRQKNESQPIVRVKAARKPPKRPSKFAGRGSQAASTRMGGENSNE